jgi:hypothetical protein
MHILHLLALTLILRAPLPDPWPQRFLWAEGVNHAYVVLYRDGSAAYSQRTRRPDRSDWYFAASRAQWNWCDQPVAARRCIQVHVEGYSDQQQASFRFDYWYDAAAITEFDKAGVQRTLRRVSNDGR